MRVAAEDIDSHAVQSASDIPISDLCNSRPGGFDTFYYISSYLFAQLSDRKDVPAILQEKMDKGELGTKAKKGFVIQETKSRVVRKR